MTNTLSVTANFKVGSTEAVEGNNRLKRVTEPGLLKVTGPEFLIWPTVARMNVDARTLRGAVKL